MERHCLKAPKNNGGHTTFIARRGEPGGHNPNIQCGDTRNETRGQCTFVWLMLPGLSAFEEFSAGKDRDRQLGLANSESLRHSSLIAGIARSSFGFTPEEAQLRSYLSSSEAHTRVILNDSNGIIRRTTNTRKLHYRRSARRVRFSTH